MEKGSDSTGVAVLSSPVRRRIVDHLASLPVQSSDGGPTRYEGCSAAQLAELLGLHVTTVRFHLDQLVKVGLLSTSARRGDGAGRPRKMYGLAQRRVEPPSSNESYMALAELLAESFTSDAQRPRTPEEAGAKWAHEHIEADPDAEPATTPGRWLARIGQLIDALEEWGYTPDVATRQGGRSVEVTLVDCPFLALASTHPDVVCGIHRGLIRGTLEQLGEGQAEVSLEPFVGPSTCLAHITSRTQFPESTSRRKA